MPPKKSPTTNDDDKVDDIVALCYVIMSCPEFKADTAFLADKLNLALARNVPRKINTIVDPYGFEFKGGKVSLKDDNATDIVPATPKAKAKASTDNDDGPKTPATGAKKRGTPKKSAAGAGNGTPNKRRKANATELIEEEAGNGTTNIKKNSDDDDDTLVSTDGGVRLENDGDENEGLNAGQG